MKRLIGNSLVVATLFIAASNVQSMDFDTVQLNLWSNVKGEMWQQKITREYAEQLPKSKAEEVSKVLSVSKAIKIAKSYVARNQPKFSSSHISSISINQMLMPVHIKDGWYYTVIFINMPSLATKYPEHTSVVVLLNGEVVKNERVK